MTSVMPMTSVTTVAAMVIIPVARNVIEVIPVRHKRRRVIVVMRAPGMVIPIGVVARESVMPTIDRRSVIGSVPVVVAVADTKSADRQTETAGLGASFTGREGQSDRQDRNKGESEKT